MGLAFGQRQLGHGRGRGQPGQALGVVQQRRRPGLGQLDGIVSQMLGQARPPFGPDLVAGLQDAPHAPAHAAPHQAGMAAVPAGEQVHDGRRLAVLAGTEHNAVVSPIHLVLHSGNSRPMAW